MVFWGRLFPPRTNKNNLHTSKNEFIRSSFGGNRRPQKPFRNYLTFSSSHNSNAIPLNASSILYRSVLTGAKEMRIKVTQFSSSSVYLLVPFRGQEMDISFFLCAFTLGPITPHHYGFCNLYSFTKILKRWFKKRHLFSNYLIIFPNLNSDCSCSNVLGLRNLCEQVIKVLFQKLYRPFTVRIDYSRDLKICKFSAFNLELQNFFFVTRIFFSNSRSEQIWK